MSLPSSTDLKYNFDDSTSSTLTLQDGRKLGYAEYGIPEGEAIFYHPGFPSPRVEGAILDHVATKVGARIISIDRPGYGWSSPDPHRSLQSSAKDTEALADHLGLERCGVLGISGGGPYALASARYLPAEKLRGVSIVCGLGSPDMGYGGMKFLNWCGWAFGRRWIPGPCRWWWSRDIGARLDLSFDERLRRVQQDYEKNKAGTDPRDAEFFGTVELQRMRLFCAQQVYVHGTDALMEDWRVLNSDFGFGIEDIRKDLPVLIWHGKDDVFVPLHHGQKVAERIGGNARLVVSDDTHASVSQTKMEEYLGELVKVIRGD